MSIVQLAARRKGIARSAALHLDCAPSAGKTGTYRFTLSIFQCFTIMTADDKNLTWVSMAIQAASGAVCEK
jgi:hypothetical protein